MTDKSHVSMEQHRCIVCGQEYDTGAILLDRRLRDSLERTTLTGNGLCPEHEQLHDDGYVALVECDQERTRTDGDTVKPENAYRTGNIAHVRRSVWPHIFDSEAPTKDGEPLPMVFIEIGVIAELQKKQPEATNGDD